MNIPGLCLICLHPGSFEHTLVDSILPPIDATSSNVDELWLVLRKILRIDDDEQRLLAAVCHTCHKEFRRIYAFVSLCEKNESILYQIKDTQMLKDSSGTEVERLMIENNIQNIKTEETDCISIDHEMEIKNEPLSPEIVDEILQELPEKDSTVDGESIIESSKMQTLNVFHSEANRTLRGKIGRNITKQQLNTFRWPSEADLETIVGKVQRTRRVFISTLEDDPKTILRKVSRTFKCDLCSEKFVTTNRLTRHKKITHGQNIVIYKCDQCSMIFSKPQHVTEHKRQWHSDVSQLARMYGYNT